MRLDFKNKKILVVGASSGIGRATAIAISQCNGQVVLTGRNRENLIKTAEMMSGDNHIIMPFDITNIPGIKDYIKSCRERIDGCFDGLVFTAGAGMLKPIRAVNMEEFRVFLENYYLSYVTLLKEFSSKRILNNSGSIVALSSRAALFPGKGDLCYSTVKSAINTASLVAAQEFAYRGVRVNTICPEMVKTPLVKVFFDNATQAQLNNLYPLGHLEAEDVADAVLFLLSDMSKKITGQNIYLSAGNTGSVVDGYSELYNTK